MCHAFSKVCLIQDDEMMCLCLSPLLAPSLTPFLSVSGFNFLFYSKQICLCVQ
jgi:hypothetical protein